LVSDAELSSPLIRFQPPLRSLQPQASRHHPQFLNEVSLTAFTFWGHGETAVLFGLPRRGNGLRVPMQGSVVLNSGVYIQGGAGSF